jgi:NAD(P)-dependent dehydrogenase (short-subunit alcohol dehydrogenase family)
MKLDPQRMRGKAGIVVGGGQTAGETIGNGRATAMVLAGAGARVLVVDRDAESARETVGMIEAAGGKAAAFEADWTDALQCEAYVEACCASWGRIDFLHNNVGVIAGDAPADVVRSDAFDRIWSVNFAGCLRSCQAAAGRMKAQRSGSIVNVSSVAAVAPTGLAAYATSKAAMNALGRELAITLAPFGIRVNTVMPGLMDTPMIVEVQALAQGRSRDDVRAARHARVPLRGGMGTGWDTAFASLYLHSDEARFVTGIELRVDGGQSALVGALYAPEG